MKRKVLELIYEFKDEIEEFDEVLTQTQQSMLDDGYLPEDIEEALEFRVVELELTDIDWDHMSYENMILKDLRTGEIMSYGYIYTNHNGSDFVAYEVPRKVKEVTVYKEVEN